MASLISSVEHIPSTILYFIRILNFIVWPLNIVGNACLIYALRKTGQTHTVSFKFIIIMSIADLSCGLVGLFLISFLLWERFQDNIYLQVGAQWIVNFQGSFSTFMIALIALDRYLHLTYLTRYSTIMNMKRGYCIVLNALFFCTSMAAVHLVLFYHQREAALILQLISAFSGISVLGSVLIFYYKAYRNLQLKAANHTSQIARSILNESKKLSKTAKVVAISAILLTMPRLLSLMFDVIKWYDAFIDQITLNIIIWFGLLIFSVNGFSSSAIFIMYNRQVKQLLKAKITRNRVSLNTAVEE